MMQARPLAVGQRQVVHIALAMQPGRRDATVWPILLGIFGKTKTKPGIEIHGVLHLGRKYVEMVDPLRMAAPVEIVAAKQKRAPLHRGIKLDLEAERIGELQRASLEWLLGESARNTRLSEEGGGLVEVGLVADLEAQP